MGRDDAIPRGAGAEPFYGGRALVMAMLHAAALFVAVDPDGASPWSAMPVPGRVLLWVVLEQVFTAGWVLLMRVPSVRARPLASLAGLAAEWGLGLVLGGVVVGVFTLIGAGLRAIFG